MSSLWLLLLLLPPHFCGSCVVFGHFAAAAAAAAAAGFPVVGDGTVWGLLCLFVCLLKSPWRGCRRSRASLVLFSLLEVLRRLSLLLLPACPGVSRQLQQQLGLYQQPQESFSSLLAWGRLGTGGHLLPMPSPLLPPIKKTPP